MPSVGALFVEIDTSDCLLFALLIDEIEFDSVSLGARGSVGSFVGVHVLTHSPLVVGSVHGVCVSLRVAENVN